MKRDRLSEDIDMNFKEQQRLLYDAQKYRIDASVLSLRAKDRDPKAVKALVDAVKLAKNPPEPKAEKPKKPVVVEPAGEEE